MRSPHKENWSLARNKGKICSIIKTGASKYTPRCDLGFVYTCTQIHFLTKTSWVRRSTRRDLFMIEVVRHRNTGKMSPRTVYSHGRLTAMTLTNVWDEVFFVFVFINTDLQRIWKTENVDTPLCIYEMCIDTALCDFNLHFRASEKLAPWHWNTLEDETLFQFVRLNQKVYLWRVNSFFTFIYPSILNFDINSWL